jgi:hypothetical protein
VLALLGDGTLGEHESRSRSSERGLGVTRSESGNRYSEGVGDCRGLGDKMRRRWWMIGDLTWDWETRRVGEKDMWDLEWGLVDAAVGDREGGKIGLREWGDREVSSRVS